VGWPLPSPCNSRDISFLEAANDGDRPCQSARIRLFNDLQHRGDCLNTRKSRKAAAFVGWVVGREYFRNRASTTVLEEVLDDKTGVRILCTLSAIWFQERNALLDESIVRSIPSEKPVFRGSMTPERGLSLCLKQTRAVRIVSKKERREAEAPP
jgi:hypothetical protein